MQSRQLALEIDKIIQNHIETATMYSPDHADSMSLSEALDVSESDFVSYDLAKDIAEHFLQKILPRLAVQFEESPNILEGGSLACKKCYRPYGEWVSPMTRVAAENVAKPGSRIIILD